MNKYEARAEAVLKKREEYNQKRAASMRRIVGVTASVACVAVILGIGFAMKSIIRPVNPDVTNASGTSEIVVTAQAEIAYNGKTVFVSKEIENICQTTDKK